MVCVLSLLLWLFWAEWLGKSQGGNGGGGQGGQPWQWLRQRKRPLDKTAGRGSGGNRADQGTVGRWVGHDCAAWDGYGRGVEPDPWNSGPGCLRHADGRENRWGQVRSLPWEVLSLSCSAPPSTSAACEGTWPESQRSRQDGAHRGVLQPFRCA